MGRTTGILSRFPSFYGSNEVDSLFFKLVKVFGQTLDQVEADLLKVMYAHYVDKADNEDSQGFNTTQKGDLDKIFTLYLENLGGTSQLRQIDRPDGAEGVASDEIYRKRIKGLINVLRNGASTREGIVAIVAANLGVVGDDNAAIAARRQIRITEFMPQTLAPLIFQTAVSEKFSVTNPNVIATVPDIRIRIRSDLSVPLVNPRIFNLTTGAAVQYQGVVKDQDVLTFFANHQALLNGVPVAVTGETPALPLGRSEWRLEASLGLAEARFDDTPFELSAFDRAQLNQVAALDAEGSRFDQAVFAFPSAFEQTESGQAAIFDTAGSGFDEAAFAYPFPAVEIGMTLFRLSPAVFQVDIPWDIPGFTDDLDKFGDRPRNQIKYIVDKVKAAGVTAVIAYEKRFTEVQKQSDRLKGLAQREAFPEQHDIEELNFDMGSAQTQSFDHEISDALTLSGAFDYTGFDSLNGLA